MDLIWITYGDELQRETWQYAGSIATPPVGPVILSECKDECWYD